MKYGILLVACGILVPWIGSARPATFRGQFKEIIAEAPNNHDSIQQIVFTVDDGRRRYTTCDVVAGRKKVPAELNNQLIRLRADYRIKKKGKRRSECFLRIKSYSSLAGSTVSGVTGLRFGKTFPYRNYKGGKRILAVHIKFRNSRNEIDSSNSTSYNKHRMWKSGSRAAFETRPVSTSEIRSIYLNSRLKSGSYFMGNVKDLINTVSQGKAGISSLDVATVHVNHSLKNGMTGQNRCNMSAIERDAKRRLVDYQGYNLNRYDFIAFLQPYSKDCPWAGAAGYFSHEYTMFGYTSSVDTHLHELGHAMGLKHSDISTNDKKDRTDAMSYVGHPGGHLMFNQPHMMRLGWTDTGDIYYAGADAPKGYQNRATVRLTAPQFYLRGKRGMKLEQDEKSWIISYVKNPSGAYGHNSYGDYHSKVVVHRLDHRTSQTRLFPFLSMKPGDSKLIGGVIRVKFVRRDGNDALVEVWR